MVNVHALIAVGVNAEGYREILGVDVTTAEDGAGWLTCFSAPRLTRIATARGLAAMPYPLRHQPDGYHAQELVPVGQDAAVLSVRPTRRTIGCSPI